MAQDTTRINILNELSFSYILKNRDSALMYVIQAGRDASALKYWKGLAISLFYQSQMENGFMKAIDYSTRALEASIKSKDERSSAIIRMTLAFQHFGLRKHNEALTFLDTAEVYCKHARDEKILAQVYHVRGMIYSSTGRTFDSFKMASEAARLFRKTGGHSGYANALTVIARIYRKVGEYNAAIAYLKNSTAYEAQHHIPVSWRNYNEIGQIYAGQNMVDSSLYFYDLGTSVIKQTIPDSAARSGAVMEILGNKTEAFLTGKDHENALKISLPLLDHYRKQNNRSEILKYLRRIGRAYLYQKKYTNALQYARESLQFAKERNSLQGLKDGAALISEVFDKMNRPDSAWYYFQLFRPVADSSAINNLNNNLTFFKAMKQNEADDAKIELLNKEVQIRQQRLNILVGGLTFLGLLVFFIFRNMALKRKNDLNIQNLLKNELQIQKLKSENEQSILKQHAVELEMQALRAQMNPHFIFNCLNAINSFILTNETETASDYLTKFSRLIRSVLQHSIQASVPLSDEIATLQLYIELEQFRFKNHFRYVVFVGENVEIDGWMIPPLLLQPFVENAIWHGLMHRKEEGGKLDIEIENDGEMLCCSITDNGVGRQHAAARPKDPGMSRKSLGLDITANRLKILNQGKERSTYFTITDLKNANDEPTGTRVTLRIPIAIIEPVDRN